jgi:hypothetical protein
LISNTKELKKNSFSLFAVSGQNEAVCIKLPDWGLDLTGRWLNVPQDEPAVKERDSADTPLLSL